ncbi:hypothetical protein [Pandoraea sp. NPDC087047]|uniref:hypothetical protein n=1 Tax=Pandoraea sp. NPDC087047 TaxID=3364390 RepID=UPI00380A0FA0
MTRLQQAMPHHAHRPYTHLRNTAPRNRRSGFADDWRAGGALPRTGNRHPARSRSSRTVASTRDADGASPRDVANATFARTLLTVAGVVGVVGVAGMAAGANVPAGPFTRLRTIGRNNALSAPIASPPPATFAPSEAVSGIRSLLRMRPERDEGGRVAPQCLPAPHARALGISPVPADSDDALSMGLSAYREDLQRVVVASIRDAVANADADTREAFANAEVLRPRHISLRVSRNGAKGWPPPSVYLAPYGIALHLRDERGRWRAFAISLSSQAPSLVTPITPCGPRNRLGTWCLAKALGPVLWGERWASVESKIDDTDEVSFLSTRAGATVSPGWPSPDTPVLESPDMEEVAEVLLERVIGSASWGYGITPTDAPLQRPRRDAVAMPGAQAPASHALASRLTVSGLECLAAVIRTGTLHEHALALLQHLWPANPANPANPAVAPNGRVSLSEPAAPIAVDFPHESFSGPFGRGVQWALPADVYVEYRPELTQNGVKVFEIDGTLYGTTVAKTRKHASDLRPLDDLRRELGPLALCRISRGVGIDVDGMCLECHTEREGEVSVTEQGATVAQHQPLDASPLVRLRVAVYSQPFEAADGRRQFFAFGRLGEFDTHDVPHVAPDSPLVDPAVYAPELNGDLAYYEQATTDGPVGARRVHLTLGDMQVAAPFGTYRDRHGTLHGVVQLSRDVFYRFTPPGDEGDAGGVETATSSPQQIHLQYRHREHRDIREYWIAQHHRAAAENAIVLPTISYGETRTLLQLYLRIWEQAPSPADVWRGLEDIPLSVMQARQAVSQLTQAIEHRVASARAGALSDAMASTSSPPVVDPDLLPTFNRLWAHWQRYPAQSDAFVNAVARDFMSRPAPLAVWSQLPFTSDPQTTREVLAIFETVFPGMADLQSLVTGNLRGVRAVQDQMREVSRNANIAVAEVTLADGTRTIYYCLSGRQRTPVPTNPPTVRFVDAGRAYVQRERNVITQQRNEQRGAARSPQSPSARFPQAPRSSQSPQSPRPSQQPQQPQPTEPPELRFAMADADLPTYNAVSGDAKTRTLDTERLILAQIYADHPAGENVVRSIVMCSRMPFCDSCAVNLAMVPYHYPDAALRFYYVAPTPRYRVSPAMTTPATSDAPQPSGTHSSRRSRHVHASL